MSKVKKVFSKEKWLESAMAQKEQGVLSDREINDALTIWVNDLDGKTMEEIKELTGNTDMREDWFVEV